jgi:hypothetical protein
MLHEKFDLSSLAMTSHHEAIHQNNFFGTGTKCMKIQVDPEEARKKKEK